MLTHRPQNLKAVGLPVKHPKTLRLNLANFLRACHKTRRGGVYTADRKLFDQTVGEECEEYEKPGACELHRGSDSVRSIGGGRACAGLSAELQPRAERLDQRRERFGRREHKGV